MTRSRMKCFMSKFKKWASFGNGGLHIDAQPNALIQLGSMRLCRFGFFFAIIDEDTRLRAHEIYLYRKGVPGNELDGWLRAECEIESLARLPQENLGVFKQYFDSSDCGGFTSQDQCTSVTERWSFASAISCSPVFN
jgi:hypothetical protein